MTNSSGTTVWQGEFKPFGEPVSVTGTVTNNLRFPGQYFDSETGLHQNYFRDYKSEIGRYVEADPIGIKQGTNHLYLYVESDPVNTADPWGLCKWTGSVTMKLGGGKKGGAGAVVLMALTSECCNHKQARGVYTAFCGGASVTPKIKMPIQTATSIMTFEGPATPSEADPKGWFSYLAGGAWFGSYGRLRTGSLVTSERWTWELGNDLGVDALIGFTIGSGNTTCCKK